MKKRITRFVFFMLLLACTIMPGILLFKIVRYIPFYTRIHDIVGGIILGLLCATVMVFCGYLLIGFLREILSKN